MFFAGKNSAVRFGCLVGLLIHMMFLMQSVYFISDKINNDNVNIFVNIMKSVYSRLCACMHPPARPVSNLTTNLTFLFYRFCLLGSVTSTLQTDGALCRL